MNGVAESLAAKLFVILALTGAYYVFKQSKEPRGIANNNPLNIREVGINWRGRIGDDGEFVQFESALMGMRAAARNLKTYRDKYGVLTISEIVQRWAPPSENNTKSYIESVEKLTGIERFTPLIQKDYAALMAAMIYHENGKQPYDESLIQQGVDLGFA